MVWFSNCWALVMAIAIVPTIPKPDHQKSRHFCPNFKKFLTKWHPFNWIYNGLASVFQIPFEIQTICNPTSFWPFKIQTDSPDFRSPLYPIIGQVAQLYVAIQNPETKLTSLVVWCSDDYSKWWQGIFVLIFFCFRPPPELLPVLGPLENTWHLHLTRPCYVALGRVLIWVVSRIGLRSFVNWVSSFPSRAQCFSEAREGSAVWFFKSLPPLLVILTCKHSL